MWFSEEASDKVGRITLDGTITEYQVPKRQRNVILAALWFDNQGNLWTQQYVDENNPRPKGPDYIVRIDKSIVTTDPSRIGKIPITFYAVPTRQTVMHRIIQGPDQAMWFTELFANKRSAGLCQSRCALGGRVPLLLELYPREIAQGRMQSARIIDLVDEP
jgi:virginiamycin B lyase